MTFGNLISLDRRPARNITNDFGRSHDICFSLMQSKRFGSKVPILGENDSLLLRSFNSKNKYNGYYCKEMSSNGDPELLTMGPYFTQIAYSYGQLVPSISKEGERPPSRLVILIYGWRNDNLVWKRPITMKLLTLKSIKGSLIWSLRRNMIGFLRSYIILSILTVATGQGILYKPENFDPTKKYPVLIIFYGKYSNGLWQFPEPAYIMMQ